MDHSLCMWTTVLIFTNGLTHEKRENKSRENYQQCSIHNSSEQRTHWGQGVALVERLFSSQRISIGKSLKTKKLQL